MRRTFPVLLLFAFSGWQISIHSQAQDKRTIVCKKSALAALKRLPKLRYQCSGDNDYDEAVLKRPERLRAIRGLESQLALLYSASWWQTEVDDLNACYVRRNPGKLTDDQKEKFDYETNLSGNSRYRLLMVSDPCYQTGYNGSNGFLLYHHASKVFVTQVLDGYFSRADDSVGIDFATLNGEEIIEISTGTGGLHPDITNYYFVINPKTNKAVPRRLFKGEKGLENSVTSALLLGDPEDAGLPADARELNIIRKHKFAASFSVYSETDDGNIELNGRKFTRSVLKWNGRYYE